MFKKIRRSRLDKKKRKMSEEKSQPEHKISFNFVTKVRTKTFTTVLNKMLEKNAVQSIQPVHAHTI